VWALTCLSRPEPLFSHIDNENTGLELKLSIFSSIKTLSLLVVVGCSWNPSYSEGSVGGSQSCMDFCLPRQELKNKLKANNLGMVRVVVLVSQVWSPEFNPSYRKKKKDPFFIQKKSTQNPNNKSTQERKSKPKRGCGQPQTYMLLKLHWKANTPPPDPLGPLEHRTRFCLNLLVDLTFHTSKCLKSNWSTFLSLTKLAQDWCITHQKEHNQIFPLYPAPQTCCLTKSHLAGSLFWLVSTRVSAAVTQQHWGIGGLGGVGSNLGKRSVILSSRERPWTWTS
jgi:hypothetical protein